MIEKLKKEQNPLSETVEKIREICPAAVTRDGKVDFEELKTSLATDVAEDTIEKYEFTWVGKNAAKAEANRPIRKTLRPVVADSKDWDNTKNLYIEGDNLDALKLLQESYLGKVKMIYIDPPYNTGNDFVYCDNFKMGCAEFIEKSGQCDADGNRLFANTKTNGRFHSDWCSMMYPRLKIARNLLTDDGAIFISIDDNEVVNLRKICDEIFGGDNFVAQMIWQQGKKSSGNLMVVNHEYVIVYVKNRSALDTNENSWKQRKEGLDKIYDQYESLKRVYGDDCSKIQTEMRKFFAALPENDPAYNSKHYNYVDEKGLFFADNSCAPDKPESRCHKPLIHPITKKETAIPSLGWRWKEETLDKMVEEGRIYFGVDEKQVPKVKKYLKEMEYELPSTVFYKDGRGASKRLETLFGAKVFEFPKDERIIESFVNMVTSTDESIIMDFFSGSATTAHAVMQLNAEDGGNRRFIMVQLPEKCDDKSEAAKAGYKTICDIGKERIRRAGEKIKAENPDKDLDVGFRVLRVDSDNMADIAKRPSDITQGQLKLDVENIVPERSDLDLLFGVMVDCGLMLDMPIETKQMDDKTYYVVNHGDLVACFEKNIPEKLIYEIARMNPVCAVFRDSSFAEPKDKINLAEIFKNITGNDKCVKVL